MSWIRHKSATGAPIAPSRVSGTFIEGSANLSARQPPAVPGSGYTMNQRRTTGSHTSDVAERVVPRRPDGPKPTVNMVAVPVSSLPEGATATRTTNTTNVPPIQSQTTTQNQTPDRKRDRLNTIRTLIAGEKEYVNELSNLVNGYVLPIKEQGVLSKEDVQLVFSNTEELLHINAQLLHSFETKIKAIEAESALSHLSVIFLETLLPEERLNAYKHYCTNYRKAIERFEYCINSVPGFFSFLENVEISKGTYLMEARDLLIKPIKRICAYPLLLQDILLYSGKDHPEYKSLLSIMRALEGVVKHINISKAEALNVRKLFEIDHSLVGCPFPLAVPSRIFVMESVFRVESKKTKQLKDRLILLFSDVILYCREEPGTRSSNSDKAKDKSVEERQMHRVLYHIPVQLALVRNVSDDSTGHRFEIVRVDTSKTYRLLCATSSEKMLWLQKTNEVILSYLAKGRRHDSKTQNDLEVMAKDLKSEPAPVDPLLKEALTKALATITELKQLIADALLRPGDVRTKMTPLVKELVAGVRCVKDSGTPDAEWEGRMAASSQDMAQKIFMFAQDVRHGIQAKNPTIFDDVRRELTECLDQFANIIKEKDPSYKDSDALRLPKDGGTSIEGSPRRASLHRSISERSEKTGGAGSFGTAARAKPSAQPTAPQQPKQQDKESEMELKCLRVENFRHKEMVKRLDDELKVCRASLRNERATTTKRAEENESLERKCKEQEALLSSILQHIRMRKGEPLTESKFNQLSLEAQRSAESPIVPRAQEAGLSDSNPHTTMSAQVSGEDVNLFEFMERKGHEGSVLEGNPQPMVDAKSFISPERDNTLDALQNELELALGSAEVVVKTGYMEKKGFKRRNWQKRWFVLRRDTLQYFTDQGAREKGEIPLANCSVSPSTRKPFCFCVNSLNRDYFMRAANQKEQQEWIEAIRECVETIYHETHKAMDSGSSIQARREKQKRSTYQANADKEGHVFYEDSGRWIQNWITLQGTRLYLFRQRTDELPHGVIELEGCIVRLEHVPKKKYTFLLSNPALGLQTRFSSTSERDMAEWIAAIDLACRAIDSQDIDPSMIARKPGGGQDVRRIQSILRFYGKEA